MTHRPILFSGPMVRALLDGRKTQTRRVLNPQPPADMGLIGIYAPKLTAVFGYETPDADYKVALRYMSGDRLWVREAWHAARSLDRTRPRDIPRDADIEHAATAKSYAEIGLKGKRRLGVFLPRWASRLTLTVTDVRVQRLQEISEADARAEGVLWVPGHGEITPADLHEGYSNYLNCREGFQVLWDGINAKRGFGWLGNPWIVALTFSVAQHNIDEVQS